MANRPALFDRLFSAETAAAWLADRGVFVSVRTLKERGRALGAYRQIGKAVFFCEDDLIRIMEPVACSASSSDRKARTGSRAARSTVSVLSEARAKLQSRKRGSQPSA